MRKDITSTGIVHSDAHHVEDIVVSMPGDFKFSPQLGFGVVKYLKSHVSETRFKGALNEQLNHDGYQNVDIDLSHGFEKLIVNV